MKKFTFLVSMLLVVASCPLTTFASDVLSSSTTALQGHNVQGVVKDADGAPVIGATVIIESSGLGSITDATGAFLLNNARPGDVVEVSSIGYKATTFTIAGSQTSYDVVMEIDGLMTDEVVVTAMGLERKVASLTYTTQQIDDDEFTTAKSVNIANSLQGKAAGLVIQSGGTGAGSTAKILMRGNKSVSDSSPLIVIDGIPMNNPGGSSTSGSGSSKFSASNSGDALSNINPEDIESINLLKGASAAALYGSMAANGVIMITTKKGNVGRVRTSYSSNIQLDTELLGPEIQKNYGATETNGVYSTTSWGDKLSDAEASKGNGRVEDFYNVGQTYINSLTLSGGTEKAQSFFSYANTYALGMIEDNTFNRHNITMRQTFNLIDDRLTLDFSASYIKQDVHNQHSGGQYMNPLSGLYTFPNNADWDYYKNNYSVFNEGSQRYEQMWYRDVDNDFSQNPYWDIYCAPNDNAINRTMISGKATFKITDYLNASARMSYDYNNQQSDSQYYDGTSTSNAAVNGRYSTTRTTYQQLYADGMLNFNKSWGDWEVTASAGVSHQNNTQRSFWFRADELYLANVFTPQNTKYFTSSFSAYDTQLNSVFATAQIGFNDFLYADITGRNDWSSTLAYTSNGSYFYPSGGLSFLLNEVVDLGKIDMFKIRGSYSVVGSAVTAYITNPLNSISAGSISLNTVEPFSELQPEKMHSVEVGIDISAFNGNLTAEATYYKTNNRNQLMSVSVSSGSGYSSRYMNAGNIQNQGIELTASYNWQINKDWRWTTSANFSYNDNKIVELTDELTTDYVTIASPDNYVIRAQVGGSYGDIYTTDYVRDDNGVIQLNTNGTPQTQATQYQGNINSDYNLGWSNNFRYKDWSASFLIDGSIGGKVIDLTEKYNSQYGTSLITGIARDNGGVDAGDGSLIDASSYYTTAVGSEFVYNATNFRLREFTLGYTFNNIFGDSSSSNLSLSFVARNLFFLYKDAPTDPGQNINNGWQGVTVYSLPSTRTFGLKVQLNF